MFGWKNFGRRRARHAIAALCALVVAGCGDLPSPGAVTSGPKVDTTQPVAVALLVPSGSGQAEFDFIGKSLENAARLAIADLNGVQIDLRVYATAGDPNRAANVAAQAVSEGAKIILGPLFGANSATVGTTVAASGVNVLSFSNNPDIAGGNVFILGNTFDTRANRLVKYAMSQGKNSFMVVSAQDAAEEKGRVALSAAIQRNGGAEVGSTAFELSQNGIVQAIGTISANTASLSPDAIVFTSGTDGAIPTLTQLLTENGVDNSKSQFVGLRRWDVPPQALELAPLQGGWFPVLSPAFVQPFKDRYAAAYGEAPHVTAGLAYDGIAAVGALLQTANGDALSVKQLTQSNGFSGANGVFRLRADGTNERGLAIATIREQKLVILDPAPRSFSGAGF